MKTLKLEDQVDIQRLYMIRDMAMKNQGLPLGGVRLRNALVNDMKKILKVEKWLSNFKVRLALYAGLTFERYMEKKKKNI